MWVLILNISLKFIIISDQQQMSNTNDDTLAVVLTSSWLNPFALLISFLFTYTFNYQIPISIPCIMIDFYMRFLSASLAYLPFIKSF